MSEDKRSASRKSQPISRHPLFPAIFALWSGALFGLASLALRPALLEHAVLALSIDKAIPMAAPPLGGTARILITLGMTGLGVLIGTAAALRIARSASKGGTKSAPAPAAKTRVAGRRRGFAAAGDSVARDLDSHAVTEALNSQILNVADFEVDSFDADDASIAPHAAPAKTVDATFVEAEVEAATEYETPLFLQSPAGEATTAFDLPSPVREEPAASGEANDDGAAQVSPAPFAEDAGEPACATAAHEEEALPAPPFSAPGHAAADRIASAVLDELSPIELLERLALAMARRRDEARLAAALATPIFREEEAHVEADAPVMEHTTEANSGDLEAPVFEEAVSEEPAAHADVSAAVEPALQQAATVASELPRLPAALRPVNLDPIAEGDDGEDDDALPAYIPPRHIGLTPAARIDEDAEGEEEQVLEHGYSSLTSLSRGTWNAPTEDEPAACAEGEESAAVPSRPFDAPGHASAPTGPEDTEKALRDALATLQRMSGAA